MEYLAVRPDPAAGKNWKNTIDLYAYYLIDVEMSSCQLTSRVKQASSSVQLFVQRCLMNLERRVLADAESDPDWLQWKWMKTYRVWEANRKVFLYPENWIEPELRDDKSSFFKDLENELLQGEVTKESVEKVFLSYLDKLDETPRLEVCGVLREGTDDGPDVVHVFARASGQPHKYYCRRRINRSFWTAWEMLDVGIEGDQVLPILQGGRPRVFWPLILEENENTKVKMPAAGQDLQEPKLIWTVQLAWSEYRNEKWSPKKISVEILRVHHAFRAKFPKKEQVYLQGGLGSDRERIEVKFSPAADRSVATGGYFRFGPGDAQPKAFPRTTDPFATLGTISIIPGGIPRPILALNGVIRAGRGLNFGLVSSWSGGRMIPIKWEQFWPEEVYYDNSEKTLKRRYLGMLGQINGDFQMAFSLQNDEFQVREPFFFKTTASVFW